MIHDIKRAIRKISKLVKVFCKNPNVFPAGNLLDLGKIGKAVSCCFCHLKHFYATDTQQNTVNVKSERISGTQDNIRCEGIKQDNST